MSKFYIIILLSIFLVGLLMSGDFVFASNTDGTIDSTYKYAWGENTGWVNFGCDNCDVHVTDSGLSGYALSETIGWIYLSDITNNSEGTLSGYAWSENAGWIKFNPDNGGVIINSSGEFTGSALGENIGWIIFGGDYKVKTDWRPASTRPTTTSGGGQPGGYYNPPVPPPSGNFELIINNGDKYTKDGNVNLVLKGGSETTKYMIISENEDFSGAGVEDYTSSKGWTLPEGDGIKTIYVKFYTQYMMASKIISDTIILDTKAPEIKITDIKEYYEVDEKIILSGTTEANAEIILHWAEKYGLIQADSQGKWTANLGKMESGKYDLELKPKDLAGNVGEIVSVSLEIKAQEEEMKVKEEEEIIPVKEAEEKPKVEEEKPIVEKPKIIERVKEIFKPKPKPEEKIEEIVFVPEKAPLIFQGKWQLLPQEPIREFVLAPLPKEIRILAEKFPELEKTFKEVGIGKITDVAKLKTVKLTLPGLTEKLGLPTAKIEPGKFVLPAGVPVAKLSSEIKEEIPSEIVFAKAGNELIDFNIALSVTEKGEPQQKISTISGKPLQVVVKPDKPVKSVKGYVVFRSKQISRLEIEESENYKLKDLAASLIFQVPEFSQPAKAADYVPLEGANYLSYELTASDYEREVETRLVLLEFEYTDPDGDGIYTAEIQAPIVEGEYEIITVMDFEDPELSAKEIRLVIVVDPEGYVYEKDGNRETRIPGAIVSLFWLNSETKQYELWPAKEYQQENPQTTDVRGTYSFLVPEGYYYLKVEAPGYLLYDGKPFQVKEGSGVHINIELKTKYWFLKVVDWKTILLIVAILFLIYNFYRDKIREKVIRKS